MSCGYSRHTPKYCSLLSRRRCDTCTTTRMPGTAIAESWSLPSPLWVSQAPFCGFSGESGHSSLISRRACRHCKIIKGESGHSSHSSLTRACGALAYRPASSFTPGVLTVMLPVPLLFDLQVPVVSFPLLKSSKYLATGNHNTRSVLHTAARKKADHRYCRGTLRNLPGRPPVNKGAEARLSGETSNGDAMQGVASLQTRQEKCQDTDQGECFGTACTSCGSLSCLSQ